MIESDVLVYLKADNALTALAGGRIYPKTAKENATYPYVIYTVGTTPNGELLKNDRLEFRIHAKKDSEVAAIRDRIRALLDKQEGIQGVIASTAYKIFYSEWAGTVPMIDKEDLSNPDYIEACIYEVIFKAFN